MKKTTWVIIGLSVCVVVLATALGIVLTQKKKETIIAKEPDFYQPIIIFSESWQKSYSFRIAGIAKTKRYYYTPNTVGDYFIYPIQFQESGQKVDFLGEKIPGFPGTVKMLKRTNQTKYDLK